MITKNFDKISDKKLIGKWKVIINNCSGNYLSLFNNNANLNNNNNNKFFQRHSSYLQQDNFSNKIESAQFMNGSPVFNNNNTYNMSRSYQNSPNLPMSPNFSINNAFSPVQIYTSNLPNSTNNNIYNNMQVSTGLNYNNNANSYKFKDFNKR